MKTRLFRRLLAFAITAFMVACFGCVVAFFYDANRGGVFFYDTLDYSAANPAEVSAFLNSGQPGRLELSSNDLRVFLHETYQNDFSAEESEKPIPMLPNLSVEDGRLKMAVFIISPFFVFSPSTELVFCGTLGESGFALEYTQFGRARIPNFMARPLFDRAMSGFLEVESFKNCAEKMESLKSAKIIDDKLVLVK